MENIYEVDKEYKYICIDLKSFYASVECVDLGLNPLTENLVVADESRTDKTICLAVSPNLKKYGLSGRSRLFEVRQKQREVERKTGEKLDYIIAPPRMSRYIEVSNTIYNIYMKYIAPEDIHVYSVDEVFIDISKYYTLYNKNAHEIAMFLIKEVLKKTGITATAGVGTNLYLAKIAMDIVAKHVEADEDGVRIACLNEEKYKQELWSHRPITDFWRIGKGTEKTLAKYNMYTMGDIARKSLYDEELFYKLFGIDAEIIIDHAWGIEPCTMKEIKEYKPQTHSLSLGQVLQRPYTFEEGELILKEMTDSLVLEMVKKGLVTNSFTIEIGYDRENVDKNLYKGNIHIDRYGRKVPKGAHGSVNLGEKTSSSKKIISALVDLYKKIVDRNLTVRRLNISANNTIAEENNIVQLNIFTDLEAEKKEKQLQKAMLEIKDKFGKNAVLRGINLEEAGTAMERNAQVGGHKA